MAYDADIEFSSVLQADINDEISVFDQNDKQTGTIHAFAHNPSELDTKTDITLIEDVTFIASGGGGYNFTYDNIPHSTSLYLPPLSSMGPRDQVLLKLNHYATLYALYIRSHSDDGSVELCNIGWDNIGDTDPETVCFRPSAAGTEWVVIEDYILTGTGILGDIVITEL